MRKEAPQNDVGRNESPDFRKSGNSKGCPNETVEIDDIYQEKELIVRKLKYNSSRTRHNSNRTRHTAMLILLISLITAIFAFGAFIVFGKKEMIESFNEFAKFSITMLFNLASAAFGFLFGRTIRD
jgi:hypothetical protein